jgi:hypothetical protein
MDAHNRELDASSQMHASATSIIGLTAHTYPCHEVLPALFAPSHTRIIVVTAITKPTWPVSLHDDTSLADSHSSTRRLHLNSTQHPAKQQDSTAATQHS